MSLRAQCLPSTPVTSTMDDTRSEVALKSAPDAAIPRARSPLPMASSRGGWRLRFLLFWFRNFWCSQRRKRTSNFSRSRSSMPFETSAAPVCRRHCRRKKLRLPPEKLRSAFLCESVRATCNSVERSDHLVGVEARSRPKAEEALLAQKARRPAWPRAG